MREFQFAMFDDRDRRLHFFGKFWEPGDARSKLQSSKFHRIHKHCSMKPFFNSVLADGSLHSSACQPLKPLKPWTTEFPQVVIQSCLPSYLTKVYVHLISFNCFAEPFDGLSNSGSSGRSLVCHTPISQCLNQCPLKLQLSTSSFK